MVIKKGDKLAQTHGLRYTRLYRIWLAMKNRCYNKKVKFPYEFYGARGITVCDEWRNDVTKFYDWAMNNGYSDDLTLDRIDGDGNYEPNNCRWVTMQEQNKNRRSNVVVTWNGKTQCLSDWAIELGIPLKTLNWRYHNWSLEKAFTTKVRGGNHEI